MYRNTERRTELRQSYKIPISVQELDSVYIYRARMVNYSDKGMYIETDISFDNTNDLMVGIEDSKFKPLTVSQNSPMFYKAKILWKKHLADGFFDFGYGTQVNSIGVYQIPTDTDLPVLHESRKHTRKQCRKLIYFTWNNQYSKAFIDNIGSGGAFILTKDELNEKQTIRFVVPGTKYDKGMMLEGEVIYRNDKGAGIKIIGVLNSGKLSKTKMTNNL